MNQPIPAAFKFDSYRFREFSIKIPPGLKEDEDLIISIVPQGAYSKEEQFFLLFLHFAASVKNDDDTEEIVVKAQLEAVFKFNSEVTEIPEYFYQNSIAIAFPFLRAFIATLTIQANVPQILLPIANLQHLTQPLKDNITVLEDIL